MGDAGELGCELRTGRGVGEIERQPARAQGLVGLAARDGEHLAVFLQGKVLHAGVANEPGGAGNQDFLGCHRATIAQSKRVYAWSVREEDPWNSACSTSFRRCPARAPRSP